MQWQTLRDIVKDLQAHYDDNLSHEETNLKCKSLHTYRDYLLGNDPSCDRIIAANN